MAHEYSSHTPLSRVVGTLSALLLIAFVTGSASDPPGQPHAPVLCTAMTPAAEAELLRLSAEHYTQQPAHGTVVDAASVVVADTFLVDNYFFDAGNNPGNPVSAIHVLQGQAVMFKWVSGGHTTTSGNPGDIDLGSIWDSPVDLQHKQVVIAFPNTGYFPFECRFHGDFLGMTGSVTVDAATPAHKDTWGGVKSRYR